MTTYYGKRAVFIAKIMISQKRHAHTHGFIACNNAHFNAVWQRWARTVQRPNISVTDQGRTPLFDIIGTNTALMGRAKANAAMNLPLGISDNKMANDETAKAMTDQI